jgi:hypothetical protein
MITRPPPNLPKIPEHATINHTQRDKDSSLKRPTGRLHTDPRRRTVDFDMLRQVDLEQRGQKIHFSEDTIDRLTKTEQPDDTDYEWVAAYNRRKEAGEPHSDILLDPPLGRQQKTALKSATVVKQQSPQPPVKTEKQQQPTSSPAVTRSKKRRKK